MPATASANTIGIESRIRTAKMTATIASSILLDSNQCCGSSTGTGESMAANP